MTKFSDKSTGDSVSATEYNNIVRASLNMIEDSGQTIDATNTQLSKAAANYSAVSTFYTDSGIVNAYVLTPIDNFEGLESLIDGAQIRVRVANTNTGAATINVNGTGVKNITLPDGTTALSGGEISSTQDINLRYDLSNDVWLLVLGIEATVTSIGNIFLPKQITVSNGTDTDHDIDFTAGNFIFSDGGGQATTSALTKRIDATWASGDNAGGLASGVSLSNDTTYHMFALSSADGAATDYGFDTSLTATNLLADAAVISAGLTKHQRIASLVTDGSANIRNGEYIFNKDGSYVFEYLGGAVDTGASSVTTTAANITVRVPSGIKVFARVSIRTELNTGTNTEKNVRLYSPDFTDITVTDSNSQVTTDRDDGNFSAAGASFVLVLTNTSNQIRARSDNSNSNNTQVGCIGWNDSVID